MRDENVYSDALINRKAASQEDTWTRAFDGPELISNRDHAMGILVDQRSLAWRFPTGNEDIIYFIYTLTNITSADPASYAAIDDSSRDAIVAIAQDWQARTITKSGITDFPAGGFRYDSLYASFGMDPDVGFVIDVNNSSAVLPFNMGFAYKSDFNEPTWLYTPDAFAPPLGPYPGFVGVKYLKSPINPATGEEVGLTLFSNTTNGGPFDDPTGDIQLWRYLSGRLDQGGRDDFCDRDPIEDRVCALIQEPADTRFYQSSGPFSLEPGQQATIVVAYVHAWPVAAEITPFLPGNIPPEIPPTGEGLAAGTDVIRVLDRAMGWVSHNDDNGDGVITQDEVVTANNSLLRKSLVAQELFDAKFLLPFAPEPPDFFLVPGSNQVTVVWERSRTEEIGDPYFDIAGDPNSALYDPNYRGRPGEGDVEGYRIYRGRSRAQLELVAQFDYAGTTFKDYTGAWAYDGNCAPEFGILDDCPADFPLDPDVDDPVENDLVGAVPQVPSGGRVVLQNGDVVVLESVNPVEDAGFPALRDTGVPFAYVDRGVVNSVQYFYAVTAFDVNSLASGPASLESTLRAQAATPRGTAAGVSEADVTVGLFGPRGTELNPDAAPSFAPGAGTFGGPAAPSPRLSVLADIFAETAIAQAEVSLRIDSIRVNYYHDGTYYLTADLGGQTTQLEITGLSRGEEEGEQTATVSAPLPADPDKASQVGISGLPFAGQANFEMSVGAVTFSSVQSDWHVGVDGAFFDPMDPASSLDGGTRWFDGENEEMADPTLEFQHGQLTGVNAIYQPAPRIGGAANDLFRRNFQTAYHLNRATDYKFYWGATGGTLDSVVDVTYDALVPFMALDTIGVGWGFRDDIAGRSTSYTPADGLLDEYDFGHGPCFRDRPNWTSPQCGTLPYLQQASLQPVDVNYDGAADGNGFALYINGDFYIFQTDALPAAPTVWTLRTYFGLIAKDGSTYSFTQKTPNAPVPGLYAVARVNASAEVTPTTEEDLADVHTVPDPYYATNSLERSPASKVLKFVNLPPQAIIRIYSLSGVLVDVIEYVDASLGGEARWDLRNRNNQFVASGVYFYHVETPSGAEKIGRFTIVNSSSIVIFGQ